MNTNKTVSAAQGAASQITLEQMKTRIEADFKCARAITHIVANHDPSASEIATYLQTIVTTKETERSSVMSDAKYASALITTILGSDLLMNQISETMLGLHNNAIDQQSRPN